jgi:predicted DsbA family dithiol-disulfide isomerase
MVLVEIWSDVMCPFCYIGKRKFEAALQSFEQRDSVQVTWRSFQLDPAVRFTPGRTLYEYLAERKGVTLEASRRMHARLTEAAAEVGLRYNFDSAIIANSFDAHRLTHLAREHGVQDKIEERLFAAYFTEGRNISDHDTLGSLGAEAGLDPAAVQQMLAGTRFAGEVRKEAREAESLGADGVPFFVFNRVFAVSGAQPSEIFLEALEKAWAEQRATGTGARTSALS